MSIKGFNMDIRKLCLIKDSQQIIDSYSSLDVPVVRNATFYSLMLIGGTATQLLARAYGVKERRKRSINDLDFLTTYQNKNINKFNKVLQEQGFIEDSDSEYMQNWHNEEAGVDVDILVSYEPDVMDRAIKVKGVLVQEPCWQFVQKLQRIVTGFSDKKKTDVQDINTLYDIIDKRGEIEKLQNLIVQEIPDIDEDVLNDLLNE